MDIRQQHPLAPGQASPLVPRPQPGRDGEPPELGQRRCDRAAVPRRGARAVRRHVDQSRQHCSRPLAAQGVRPGCRLAVGTMGVTDGVGQFVKEVVVHQRPSFVGVRAAQHLNEHDAEGKRIGLVVGFDQMNTIGSVGAVATHSPFR